MTAVAMWVQSWLELAIDRLGLQREEGQTGIEYAMVAVVIIAAVGAAYVVAGPNIKTAITGTLNQITALVSNSIAAATG